MNLEITTEGNLRVNLGAEDGVLISRVVQFFLPQKTEFLNQELNLLRDFYREAKWLQGEIAYEAMADAQALSGPGWAKLKWADSPFALPLELHGHRNRMVELFQKAGRMRAGLHGKPDDQPCPRVKGFDATKMEMTLQAARYTDQVATNLTLDYKLEAPFSQYGETLRLADRTYALEGENLHKRAMRRAHLRPLETSFLANTLGVACMVVFPGGEIFYRVRSKQTAIYGGQPHVPISFAAEMNPGGALPETLRDLVMPDLATEFNQETRLEMRAFIGKVEPLGLCRDIGRGGKPQLFLKLKARTSAREFREAMEEAVGQSAVPEYTRKTTIAMEEHRIERDGISAELACGIQMLVDERGREF